MEERIARPRMVLMEEADKDRLHATVLRILAEIGMRVQHDRALESLKAAGCRVDPDGRVMIPGARVQEALQSAPRSVMIHDRLGRPAMDLGERRCYFGTGSDLLFTLDWVSGERRRSVLADVERAARLCDALPNLDFVMSFAHPSDVPTRRVYLESFRAMVEGSTKPIVCTAEGGADLTAMWEIAARACGGAETLRRQPYFIHYAEPTSPLTHPPDSLDKLILCAEKGIPAIYSPAPLAGASAPLTMAGHVAQGLAESLCGLVIHQLTAPGAPFILGMGPAVLDMRTAQSSYNAPEYYLAYLTIVEMSRYYGLPNWGYAGTSDSQIPDEQAAFESGLCSFLTIMAGSNLNHDVGYLDFGRTASLEMVVMGEEMIGMFRRFARGVPLDDDSLAFEVIREAAAGGDFLTHMHTMRHLTDVQWLPKLICREGFEKWEQAGRLTLLERARARLEEILETHQPEPLPDDVRQEIAEIVEGFRAEG